MASETVLITGATGFLGSNLVKNFVNKRYKVIILKRSTSDIYRINEVFDKVISYDVDSVSIQQAFIENDIDVVIHTACNYGRSNESLTKIVQTNILFGLEVLESSIKFSTDTFINTDTFSNTNFVLQKHLNVYARTKKQFVEWLQMKSTEIQLINMKLEHMYGPEDNITKFVPWVISQLRSEVEEIKLTKGIQKRDFIFVDDVVSAFEMVLNNKLKLSGYTEFDTGTGILISLKEFVKKIKSVYEAIEGNTTTRLNFGAIPYKDDEMMSVNTNNKKLLELGWEPLIGVEEGLRKIIVNKNLM